jgi:rhamnose utilization protein RhaD (predicted bifunctional aldolase and dehydrogenase)
MGLVPYIMPGFRLAKKAAEVFESGPEVDGLVLLKHGIFTFGKTAREAYEHMIAAVSLAEERLARRRTTVFTAASLPAAVAGPAEVAPILRGACAIADPSGWGPLSGSSSSTAQTRRSLIT